jgi:hypothetical protein
LLRAFPKVRDSKCSAQTLKGRRRQGSSRMAAIRHVARGAAREPDGGTPGRTASAWRGRGLFTAQ